MKLTNTTMEIIITALLLVLSILLWWGIGYAGDSSNTNQAASEEIRKAAADVSASSWDIWDIVLPDTIKKLPPSTLLTVGVLFSQALGWNLTKTNVAKWEMENENACPDPTDTSNPNCTAGGIVSKRGTTYPVAPLLGTHPTQSDVDTYYISLIVGELLAMIFMPEIMKGLNSVGHLFTPKDIINITPANVETWRISFGATLLAWEAGSCLYAVSVKKEF